MTLIIITSGNGGRQEETEQSRSSLFLFGSFSQMEFLCGTFAKAAIWHTPIPCQEHESPHAVHTLPEPPPPCSVCVWFPFVLPERQSCAHIILNEVNLNRTSTLSQYYE